MCKFKFSNEVWSLIPARSGSKRIKNKNLKKIGKFTLVAHAIRIAKKTKNIDRIFVSTDSNYIKKESNVYNAEVPFLRSKKASSDNANDYEVLKEFLIKIYRTEKKLPEFIILLRPTTPLRNQNIIDKAIIKFKKLKNYDSLVSVHEMNEPVHKKFFINKNKLKPVIASQSVDSANNPRQSFPKSYTANGYLDIIKTKNIFEKKYLGKKCFPFIINKTIDIDDKTDLFIANCLNSKKFPNVSKI